MSGDRFHGRVSQAVNEIPWDVSRTLIERELLHYDLLQALDEVGLLNNLIFHGGTALRLCHGNPRLSEDLDFCTTSRLTEDTTLAVSPAIVHHLKSRYDLEVRCKPPKLRKAQEGINVLR